MNTRKSHCLIPSICISKKGKQKTAMRAFVISFYVVLIGSFVSFRVAAQQAFSAVGEIQLSEAQAGTPLSIALRKDGACWVVWGKASQWLNADLSFNGTNSWKGGGGSNALPMPDGRSAAIMHTLTSGGNFTSNWYSLFAFSSDNPAADSIASVWATMDTRGGVTADYSNFLVTSVDAQLIGDSTFFCINQLNYGLARRQPPPTGMYDRFCTFAMYVRGISPITGSARNVSMVEDDLYNTTGDQWYWNELGINNSCICPITRRTFAMYKRQQQPRRDPQVLSPAWYERSLTVMDINGQIQVYRSLIDSVEAQNTDLSERIVASPHDGVYLFRRNAPGDSVIVEDITFGGRLLSSRFLFQRVRTFQKTSLTNSQKLSDADYVVRKLSDGRIVIAWTAIEPDNSTNVYAALYDEEMRARGLPVRINSDPSGNQNNPAMEVNGDTVYVAWLDARAGGPYAYMRRFKADQLVDAETCDQPSGFAIENICPNPVTYTAIIRFSISSHTKAVTSLSLFDVFGREVKRILSEQLSPGTHTAQFIRDGLPSGMYNLVLRSGGRMQRKSVVVVR